MKTSRLCLSVLALAGIVTLAACSTTSAKAPDVAGTIRTSLDQAGFKDVATSQDRDKGIVTLGGHVATDIDKARAESIAKSIAGAQVVANQIAVLPPGVEGEARKVNSALDKGISANMDAALIQYNLRDGVKYAVKNQVVTLSGEVNSEALRTKAEGVAAAVPNVQQVVNELQVKGQKATSSR